MESINQLTISICSSENRLPDHPVGLGHAKFTEDCGGDIPQLRRSSTDWTITEQNAGNQVRCHAVVANPSLGIVFQHVARHRTEGGLPGGAVLYTSDAADDLTRVDLGG